MSKQEQQDVRNYFSLVLKYNTKEDFTDHSISSLVFSYLMGIDPEECNHMCVESEWSDDEINEYDEIESFIWQLIKEFD